MARQNIVVGDIQGCLGGLQTLLAAVDFDPKLDRLFAVGDLVGRGSDSLGTTEYLMQLGDSFQAVLGNHDLNFLAVSQGFKQAKKSDKLDPLLESPKLPDIINWFRQLPLAHKINDDLYMVHAGLYPNWSPENLLAYSNEISEVLCSDQWQSLLKNMYGREPVTWSSSLSGIARHRFIINACTRMRYIRSGNKLDFDHNGHPKDAPEELTPWFEVSNPALNHERIVFGHWAALSGLTLSEQFIGLDTGYVWGQKMTALRLETSEFISVSAD